jgi:isopentenyl-diphosphate delta-isomerase
MEQRKKDHIDLAFSSQVAAALADQRFNYEPVLGSHPHKELDPIIFLGKTMRTPMWVSSMTGGTKMARTINTNLARACNEFGMGMGLGSCRILLENPEYFGDFNMREVIGDELPLYANIGIAQLEEMIANGSWERMVDLTVKLQADGMIIHVNPMQEWLQLEGDVLKQPPIDTIERFLSLSHLKIIVKEVGQGMGPESIRRLLHLPIEALELAAFGGTNFARAELSRNTLQKQELYAPLSLVGHSAVEMVEMINSLAGTDNELLCRQLIISGGIKSFLDGFYFLSKSVLPAVYGQASEFLRYAQGDYQDLQQFVAGQVNGLKFARAFLRIRNT